MKSILIILHCESNTGFAIAPLELAFYRMALALCDNDPARVHFAYPSMQRGPTTTLPREFHNYLVLNPKTSEPAEFDRARRFLVEHEIDTIFGFDQPVSLPIYKHYRRAGVRTFMSYWGAPMSSLFGPVRLALRRFEVRMRCNGPNHYIFESKGMADTAVLGRGIPRQRTSIVPLGVDIDRFQPNPDDAQAVFDIMRVPDDRRVFFYSGHMEQRKGVDVIMQAANQLAERRQPKDWHIVLYGNRNDDHLPYLEMLDPAVRSHVTFGGYRNDLQVIQRGCFAAIVASTGWDSFPRSALEAQASGLPLLASNLPGLNETIVDGTTGVLFPVGNGRGLSDAMQGLLDDPARRDRMAEQARKRIVERYSLDVQLTALVASVRAVLH
jgi:glycosyltransferase involved in cell wall biosynthesis